VYALTQGLALCPTATIVDIGAGVTLFDAADAAEVPLALVAVTVNVYAVVDDNPLTVIGLDDPVPVIDSGEEVAVKVVIAEPPVAPAVNGTVAEPSSPVAVPIVGACGTVVAVMLEDAAEVNVPFELAAETVNV
jgi:hypothetical protein